MTTHVTLASLSRRVQEIVGKGIDVRLRETGERLVVIELLPNRRRRVWGLLGEGDFDRPWRETMGTSIHERLGRDLPINLKVAVLWRR